MSELINAHDDRAKIRWQLLATVSTIALLGSSVVGEVSAADSDTRPTVWIELGGQLSRLDDPQEAFVQAFPNAPPRPESFSPSQAFEKLPQYSFDETGAISVSPSGSSWVFSAAVRYGRSSNKKEAHQQTSPQPFSKYTAGGGKETRFPLASKFADTTVRNTESHFILDFQVGRDVGLGLFGRGSGSSVLSLGVRFAQFASRSNVALKSDPDWHFQYKYIPTLLSFGYHSSKVVLKQYYHTNRAQFTAARSFHGVGPSLSWKASAPLSGDTPAGELLLDWGVNGAVLFGRQRAKIHHQAMGQYHSGGTGLVSHPSRTERPVTYHPTPVDRNRIQNVVVPNFGGFAGLTYRMDNFKMSAGYKADFFFGAIDGGIDTHKSADRGFFGPFATVSLGLGG